MVWGVLPFASSQVKLIAPLKSYGSTWDERQQAILTSLLDGKSVVVTTDLTRVKTLNELRSRLWLVGDLETGPDSWINRCAAEYYGVNEIVVK
jgi:hypothetical protein